MVAAGVDGGRERAGQRCDARERRDDERCGGGGCERRQEQGSRQRRNGRNRLRVGSHGCDSFALSYDGMTLIV